MSMSRSTNSILPVIDFAHSLDVKPQRVYQLIREGQLGSAVYRASNGQPYIDTTHINDGHLLALQFKPTNDIEVYCEDCEGMDHDAVLTIPHDTEDPFIYVDHHIHIGDSTTIVSVSIRLTEELMNAINTRWSDIHVGNIK